MSKPIEIGIGIVVILFVCYVDPWRMTTLPWERKK